MKKMTFFNRLAAAQERNQSLLCVGLDPDPAKLRDIFKRRDARDIAKFNNSPT